MVLFTYSSSVASIRLGMETNMPFTGTQLRFGFSLLDQDSLAHRLNYLLSIHNISSNLEIWK